MKNISEVDILAVGVHPDDVELSCSGTLLKHINDGMTVGLLDLTRGELGTRGTPELRRQEALAAAEMLGASFRIGLDLGDGFLDQSENGILQVIQVIRASRPKIILANAIKDRHIDHGKAAKFIRECSFLSGLRKIVTQYDNESQMAYRPSQLYHYIQDYYIEPDFVVDISEYIDQKFDLIMCFKSQFFNPSSKEPRTAISSEDFISFLRGRAMEFGRPIGVSYAEGYTCDRRLGIKNLRNLI